MQAGVIWKQELKFKGVGPNGQELDLSNDNGGDITPKELTAVALAGCTAMDVISILEKKRQQVTAFEVRVDTQSSEEHPQIWTHGVVNYIVTGKDIDPQAVERAIQLSIQKYCPVMNMLNKAVEFENSLRDKRGLIGCGFRWCDLRGRQRHNRGLRGDGAGRIRAANTSLNFVALAAQGAFVR